MFPRISNLRSENISNPNSAASGNQQNGQTMQANMNALKNSGGHISGSGMVIPNGGINDRSYYRGAVGGGMATSQGMGVKQAKPLSSPLQPQNQIVGEKIIGNER